MQLTDTANAFAIDMNTLIKEGFFNKGRRFGGIEFNEVSRGKFKGLIVWKGKEPYKFRITAEVDKYGIVRGSFAIGAHYEYFDASISNHHSFVLVYEDGENNVDTLRKTLRALAQLTVSRGELNV